MAEIFSSERFVKGMLHFEATLAAVQADLGIIPAEAAHQISEGVETLKIDWEKMQQGTNKAGIPVPELMRQLRNHIGEAGTHVHWGATTQDVIDTTLVMQMRDAFDILESNLTQLIDLLANMAEVHRHSIMVGRTRSQAALPITFGLKVAGWLAPLIRHRERLAQLKTRLLVVEFGGAVGTLASLGDQA